MIPTSLILIGSHFEQLEPLLLPLDSAVRERVATPGTTPTTWVLPCLPDIPVWLRGSHSSLAVRVTTHPQAIALCDTWGAPLVSTSANPAGRPPAQNALRVRLMFGSAVDFIVHGDVSGADSPTSIRDLRTGKLIRA